LTANGRRFYLKSLAERLDRDLSYAGTAQRQSAAARLVKQTTQAWYADFESLLFYFIGQAFACFLVNLPLVYFFQSAGTVSPGGVPSGAMALPPWVAWIWALLNGIIVAALYMRPALQSRRMSVAVPLFTLASLISLISYLGGLVISMLGERQIIPLVGLATLAMLLCTAAAQRGSNRD
jgi:hypothetical protein